MAINGRINGKVTLNSSVMSFFLTWSAESNIDGNYSDVTVTSYWQTNSTSWGFDTVGARPASITINGIKSSVSKRFDTTAGTGSGWKVPNPWEIQTATQRVYHNSDGTKTIAISARANGKAGQYGPSADTYESEDCTASGSIVLENIPRASSVKATNADIESNPVISIVRASNTFRHTLEYYFSSDGKTVSGTIATKTSAEKITDWKIPASVYEIIPNKQSVSGRITCDTYSGNTLIGTSSTTIVATVNIDKSAPTLNPTAIDVNSNAVALTGDESKFIRYRSNADVKFNAVARNSASIVSRKVTCGSQTLSGDGTIMGVDSGTFVFSVTDSRGYTTSITLNKELVNYIPLSCSILKEKFEVSGEIFFDIAGACFVGNFGSQQNEIVVQYRYKLSNEDWSDDWITVENNLTNDTYSASVIVSGFDYTRIYSIQARVIDKLDSISSNSINISSVPVFDWSENDFNFNVPVNVAGKLTVNGKELDASNIGALPTTGGTMTGDLQMAAINASETADIAFARPSGHNYEARIDVLEDSLRVYTWDKNGTYGEPFRLSLSNGALKVGSVVGINDYVTEQGTSGGWTYRKWNSGVAECWAHFALVNVNMTNAWGSMYESPANQLNFPSGLFSATPTYIDIQLAYSGGVGAFIERGGSEPTKTATDLFYFVRPTSFSGASMKVYAHAIGKWK